MSNRPRCMYVCIEHSGVETGRCIQSRNSPLYLFELAEELTKISLQKHLLVPNTPRPQDSPVCAQLSHVSLLN
jgi:hypothetical protein